MTGFRPEAPWSNIGWIICSGALQAQNGLATPMYGVCMFNRLLWCRLGSLAALMAADAPLWSACHSSGGFEATREGHNPPFLQDVQARLLLPALKWRAISVVFGSWSLTQRGKLSPTCTNLAYHEENSLPCLQDVQAAAAAACHDVMPRFRGFWGMADDLGEDM